MATVTIGGTAATNVAVVDSTTITATTPAHAAGQANVIVAVSGQASNTLTNAFTYAAPPTVTAVSPVSGPLAGSTPVTITGTGFVAGATVTFGAAAATSVVVSSATQITCNSPAGSAGAVTVTVTNSNGLSGNRASGFTYAGAPTITSITPNVGPTAGATSVVIAGTNFYAGATVTFGGTAATGVTVSSATSITAVTPAHTPAGAVNVVVTSSGQTATSTNGFTYQTVTAAPVGVYGGLGVSYAAKATTVTWNGTTMTTNLGDVLGQLKATPEQNGDIFPFPPGGGSMNEQYVYLVFNASGHTFQDANTTSAFAMDTAIPVTLSGTQMYLYCSKNALYQTSRIQIMS